MGIRSRLAAVAALVVASTTGLVAITATQQAANAIGPDLLPVTVTNNSGRSEAVYIYILGQDIRPGGRLGYVNGAGQFFNWPAGGNPPTPAPDVAIAGPGNGGSVTVRFPRFISARMYFSFGRKLDFRLTPDGLVQPAPWAGGDPNRDILFDWSEFTYNDAGLWLNSSQVDMFAIPHAVSVTGSDGRTIRTGDVGRQRPRQRHQPLRGAAGVRAVGLHPLRWDRAARARPRQGDGRRPDERRTTSTATSRVRGTPTRAARSRWCRG